MKNISKTLGYTMEMEDSHYKGWEKLVSKYSTPWFTASPNIVFLYITMESIFCVALQYLCTNFHKVCHFIFWFWFKLLLLGYCKSQCWTGIKNEMRTDQEFMPIFTRKTIKYYLQWYLNLYWTYKVSLGWKLTPKMLPFYLKFRRRVPW